MEPCVIREVSECHICALSITIQTLVSICQELPRFCIATTWLFTIVALIVSGTETIAYTILIEAIQTTCIVWISRPNNGHTKCYHNKR